MKKLLAVHAVALCLLAALVPVATARSVSYTGDGSGCGTTGCPDETWAYCTDLGYLDAPFDACAGVFPGNVVHGGDLRWCTYSVTDAGPLFELADDDALVEVPDGGVAAGTLVFRRSLRGPLTLQFNGLREDGDPFNITFGFGHGFFRGDALGFDFTAELHEITGLPAGKSGAVGTISIYVGGFDFPPQPESGSATTDSPDEGMTRAQALKCQNPGPPGWAR